MKLPVIKPRQAIKAFQRGGWYIDHQTGSHVIMCHEDNRPVTLSIPRHERDMPKVGWAGTRPAPTVRNYGGKWGQLYFSRPFTLILR